MKKLLIVDDDALIRATLHTIVDWNELGYELKEMHKMESKHFKY